MPARRRHSKEGPRRKGGQSLNRRQFIKGAGSLLSASVWVPGVFAEKPAAPPNILFILTDQQRYPYVGAYGIASVETPSMDSIARRGVLFSHAFCATPQCSPSRSAIMTGLYPHATGVMGNIGAAGGNPLPAHIPALGRHFFEGGYRTGYFGKWHLGGDPHDHGWLVYDGCGRGIGDRVAEESVKFLDEVREPFLLFCSFLNPHDIYGFKRLSKKTTRGKDEIKLPANLHDDLSKKPRPQLQYLQEDQGRAAIGLTKEGWIDYLNVYEHLVEKVDGDIGKILAALRRAEVEERTVIVFTSDHGDHCGGHGLPFKGPAMYEELVRIPLVISFPGRISSGQQIDELVVNVDLFPTLCDLAGLRPPQDIHGRSLNPLLKGEKVPWHEYVIGQYYSKQSWVNPIRMVRTKRWKYTRYRKWGEELYDLRKDPGELENLARTAAYAEAEGKLRGILDQWIEKTGDPFDSLHPTNRAGRRV